MLIIKNWRHWSYCFRLVVAMIFIPVLFLATFLCLWREWVVLLFLWANITGKVSLDPDFLDILYVIFIVLGLALVGLGWGIKKILSYWLFGRW